MLTARRSKGTISNSLETNIHSITTYYIIKSKSNFCPLNGDSYGVSSYPTRQGRIKEEGQESMPPPPGVNEIKNQPRRPKITAGQGTQPSLRSKRSLFKKILEIPASTSPRGAGRAGENRDVRAGEGAGVAVGGGAGRECRAENNKTGSYGQSWGRPGCTCLLPRCRCSRCGVAVGRG